MLKAKLLGATAAAEDIDISDYFSTYLYTGNGSTQTITNGIDLAGEGGLVWIKSRTVARSHNIFDSERVGVGYKVLSSDTTGAESDPGNRVTAFNSDGFTMSSSTAVNGSAENYASWTFRKAPRFFDVVTYTGNAAANQTINHNLGSAPGFMILKATNAVGYWYCYHRSLGATKAMSLNTTDAETTLTNFWFNTAPTATQFTVGTVHNDSGVTYVAYLFAHDPLGPSGDGSDGLIACGLHTQAVTGANELINLGWEPQWVLTKMANLSDDWILVDNMRGFLATANSTMLRPNLANSDGLTNSPRLASNGFVFNTTAGQQHIYIAIRRGPMREPTSGTQVFAVDNGDGSSVPAWTSGFPVDMAIERSTAADDGRVASRLTSGTYLITNSTAAETANSARVFDYMNGWLNVARSTSNYSWMFRRAPGFFDVVAYTGNGVAGRTVSHNLGVAPEMLIFKRRDALRSWAIVHHEAVNRTVSQPPVLTGYNVSFGFTVSGGLGGVLNGTAPTNSIITLSSSSDVNVNAGTYIAYLFATLPGISKCGSYTGNGSNQTINCGFTGGARFVLIKRCDDDGDWYVWDTARGIVAGNDPHLSLNTTAAEVTTNDSIDPDSSGFIVNQVTATNINVSSATYIYLAIA
jgi:hypothetical protein